MGQKIGKAEISDEVVPFCNLSRRAILSIWQVFNSIADGFGISIEELQEICIDLKDELNMTKVSITERIAVLFRCFDTDSNGLIDALEFFSTIVVLSGMKKRAIIEFILTVYDFDGTECLSFDEVVLSLKSVSSGLCKIQTNLTSTREKIQLAKEEEIEQIVSEIFKGQNSSGELDESIRLSIKILGSLLTCHPDVNCWFAYYSSPVQTGMSIYDLTKRDLDYTAENPIRLYSQEDKMTIDWNVRSVAPDPSSAVDAIQEQPPPWKSAVALLVPVEYAEKPLRKESPTTTMQPEWIYGYQSELSKSNLHYTHKGDIIYHISKYAIVYSIKLHEQQIFSGHVNDILTLKLHPNRLVVASGEVGVSPTLLVWNVDTHKILYSFQGYHRHGITQLSFSPCGKYLISIGNDVYQSLSICSWEDGTIIFNDLVNPSPCLCCTILNGNTIVAAGHSFIFFWSKYPDGYIKRAGIFSRYNSLQPITALGAIYESENLVSGTASGLLQLWVDINCLRSVKAHNGTVNTIYTSLYGIFTGGIDQRIRLWSINLEPSFTFDVSHFGLNPSIRSLCLSADNTSILVGTKGANIYEISAIDGSDLRGGPIVVGHSYGSAYCVDTHPSKFEFATVGQDQTLRIFDMGMNTQLKIATFEGEVKSVAYNPVGDMIAIGFGDLSNPKKCGAVAVLNEEDLFVVHEAKDSNAEVTVMLFSPEGETLAVGYSNGHIILYAVHDEYELVGRCDRHTNAIISIDFSQDGEWIRSNSIDRDLCYFNSDDASYQSNIGSMRDIQWNSHNCIYSWHVLSSHECPFTSDQIICNSACPVPEELTGTVETFLASGTRLGHIRLYPFPCAAIDAECHRYPAHTCEISSLKFSFNGEQLLSLGLNDRCIIQWKCIKYSTDSEVKELLDPIIDTDLKLELYNGIELQSSFIPKEATQAIGLMNPARSDLASILNPPPVPETPENVVWLSTIVEPAVNPTIHTKIPDMSIVLEHVYGYECQILRNSVRYSNTDQIVYTVSTMGVIMTTSNQSQRIYKLHTDFITSFACSRDGSMVATGQQGHQPFVSIWSTKTCETQIILPEIQQNAVSCMSFSPNNQLIAVVSLDKDHTISIYDWRMRVCISKSYGGCKRILGIYFNDINTDDGSNVGLGLVSYGDHEIRFWKNISTRFPSSIRPVLGENGSMQTFLSGAQFMDQSVVGSCDGYIYVFRDESFLLKVKAHTGPLTAMDVCYSKKQLVTGGKDGSIRLWTIDYTCLKEFVLESILESHNTNVRSVAFNPHGTHLVVGTRAAEICELSIDEGTRVRGKSLVDAHAIRQLWGLASHPTKEECITSGDDCTIRVWDCKNYSQKKSFKMDTASRAICYSPDGKLIAIGFGSGKRVKGKLPPKEGAYAIMRSNDFKIIHEGKDTNSAIRVIKFSPDLKTLAIGSDDNNLYLYNIKEEYSRRCTISSHLSPVLYADFSVDGLYVVSVDLAKIVHFHDVKSGVQILKPESLKNEKWATITHPYLWAVKGFWQSLPKNVVPTAIQRSWGGLLLAAGSNAGNITIGHNPYPKRSGFLQCSGHAGHISSVAWLAGDGALMSIGSRDHTLMQWKCIYDGTRESGDEGGRSCGDSDIEIDGGHELSSINTNWLVRSTARKQATTAPSTQALSSTVAGAVTVVADQSAAVESKSSNAETETGNWLSMICAPSNLPKDDQSLPSDKFLIDFAQGARLGDSRKILRYNDDGDLIYALSSIGVIFDRKKVTQIYYLGHKYAIISLEVDHNGKIVATGDITDYPEIHLWDAKTCAMIIKFDNLHRQGVSCLSFSPSGEYLVSLGQDVQSSIVICHSPTKLWTDGHVVCSTPVTSSKMLWCLYTSSSSSSSTFPIVVGGDVGVVFFFRVVLGSAERTKGVYGKRYKIQPLLCAIEASVSSSLVNDTTTVDNNSNLDIKSSTIKVMLCGTVTGYIYLFYDSRVVNRIAAHDAPINALSSANKNIVTAGKDGKVKLWSYDLKLLHTFNINSFLPRPYHLSCHAIVGNKEGTRICVGMKGGEIFEISLQSHSYILLFESHSRGELFALDINPINADEYVTCSDDGVVMVWSISRKYCLRKVRVESASRAIAWSLDGELIVVGFGSPFVATDLTVKDGAIMILDSTSLAIIREERKSKQAITDIKFGPLTSGIMAVASSDGRVYIHGTKKFELLRTIETPVKNCGITKIDFTMDGIILRMCTNFNQLFYYNLEGSGSIMSNASFLRDKTWLQPSAIFTWESQGVFRQGIDDVQVSSVSIHPHGRLIAASYANGDVRVFRYPCISQQSLFISLPGTSSNVPIVKFSKDGRFLLALDARTRSIIQYSISSPLST